MKELRDDSHLCCCCCLYLSKEDDLSNFSDISHVAGFSDGLKLQSTDGVCETALKSTCLIQLQLLFYRVSLKERRLSSWSGIARGRPPCNINLRGITLTGFSCIIVSAKANSLLLKLPTTILAQVGSGELLVQAL